MSSLPLGYSVFEPFENNNNNNNSNSSRRPNNRNNKTEKIHQQVVHLELNL